MVRAAICHLMVMDNRSTAMTYHSEVLSYLTTIYGVTDAEIIHRGSAHPKLLFTWADKRCHVTLQRDQADNPNLVHMKCQDLRRLLGEPPVQLPTLKRSLDQMTAELQAKAPPTQPGLPFDPAPVFPPKLDGKIHAGVVMGYICRYKSRLKFQVPPKLAQQMKGQALRIERMSHDSWRLLPFGPESKRQQPQIRLHFKVWEFEAHKPLALYEKLPLFGPSPAEYLLVNGELLVRLLTGQLKPLRTRRSAERVKAAPPTKEYAVDDPDPKSPYNQPAVPASVISDVTPAQMHAALAEIRRIEQLSLYRLVKLAGKTGEAGERWVFRAPLIE
jgi:hypothetical protein